MRGEPGGNALERCQSRRRRQQLAQDDRSRHADALTLEIELHDAIRTQRGERDPAEVGHGGVLEHCLGQSGGCTKITAKAVLAPVKTVPADTA